MRALSSRARSAGARVTAVSLLCASSLCASLAHAVSFQPVLPPRLNLEDLGRVALVGNFDAISVYEFVGQNQDTFVRNGSDSLLTRFPNGAFTAVQSADATIEAMCPYVRKDGSVSVVIGGNFTSLGGVQAAGVALYDPETNEVSPAPGLKGQVTSLLCDDDAGIVYVGGSFSAANSTNAIAWAEQWTELPFAGFNGPVTSIVRAPTGNVIFGGQFDGLGNTSQPHDPDEQVIPINTADVTAGSSSSTEGFSDPRNIICKTGKQQGPGNTWLAEDDSPAFWDAQFDFGFVPTKLRLYNTNLDGRGTKTFRFTALPLNGILNLTFVDPDGVRQYCDSECTLPADNLTYQDFNFVNPVGLNEFRVDISEWYGPGAGLTGIELFQDDIFSFAVNKFNEPACDGVSTSASASVTGPWTVTPSFTSGAKYLTAQLDRENIDSTAASVVFKPNIKQSGNYSVIVYTPGCVDDVTCDTRGQVTLTGTMAPTDTTTAPETSFSAQLYQTNDYYKYDEVYLGYIEAGDDAFQPAVTLAPTSGQSGPLTVVAQRVRFELRSSTGGLNGLFEFDPNKVTINTDFSKSTIDQAGMDLADGAVVNSMVVKGQTLFVAGDFSSSRFSNVFELKGESPSSLPGSGLNSEVLTVYDAGSLVYMGGNFTNTRDEDAEGLGGVCAYSVSDESWTTLGAGVDGIVMGVTPVSVNLTANEPEDVLMINGKFKRVLGFGNNKGFDAAGFAIWVPSRNNWLDNLGLSTVYISGSFSSFTNIPGQEPLYAGSASSQMLGASGAVRLVSGGSDLEAFDLNIDPQEPTSAKKRSVNSQNFTGVTTGLFYNQHGMNLTIYGGHFSAIASDGSTIRNLLFLDGSNDDKISGAGDSIDAESEFLALATGGTTLYAGGAVSGNVNGGSVDGLVVYDLKTLAFADTQPPALVGPNVAVNGITFQPDSPNLFVGGSFDSAGAFDCPALCVFDTARHQWTSPGPGLSGVVSNVLWTSDSILVITGELEVDGQSTSIATYDADEQTFTVFTDAGKIPGMITALALGNSDGSELWVAGQEENGTPFLMKFDGDEFQSVGDDLDQGTVISSLQVFTLTESHDSSDTVEDDQDLLVVGQLNIAGFGNASAALFDGTKFNPFILSTTAENTPGYLSSVFVQKPQNFFSTSSDALAVGFIVLIALAIALALTFLTIIAGFAAEHIRKKRQGYIPAPQMFDKTSNLNRIPPEHLFSNLLASHIGNGSLTKPSAGSCTKSEKNGYDLR